MQQNFFKFFITVFLIALFTVPQFSLAQSERQNIVGNSEFAPTSEGTVKAPQQYVPLLTADQLSRIRIPNIQITNNAGDGPNAVYLSQDFEAAFTGTPAAPPTWTQNRFVLLGDGTPEANGIDGEKDWQQNTWTGSAWTIPGFSSGVKPTGAVSGTGVLYMEDSYFGSTSSGGFGSRRVETPSVNLTTSTSPYVRFYYFYAAASSGMHVRVMASSNGGTTWNPIMQVPPNAGITATMTTATPWQRINVLIPGAYRTANAKFGIEMVNTWGTNDIFVDDFVIEDFTPTTITSAATGNWSATTTWVGGVVPTADNHVVIDAGHVVSLDVNIARCQNVTVNGTLAYGTTSTTQLLHVLGNFTVNVGGVFNSYFSTTGKRAYFGGNFVNNGSIDFSVGAGNLVWIGGSPSTYSGSGIITNGFISNTWHTNSGGLTYNSPYVVRNVCGLYEGVVNPNGNLTLGFAPVLNQYTEKTSRASFSSAPIFAAGITRSVAYITANLHMPTKVQYSTGNEVYLSGGIGIVDSIFALSTYDNIQLSTPVEVGTSTKGGLTLSRGILITSDVNLLTLNSFISGPTGTAPSILTPPTTHGSYVVGPIRTNFPATGLTSRNFALGVGTGFNGSTPNSNVLKTLNVATTSAWASQTLKVSITGAPSGTVNVPLTSLMGPRAYRIDRLGGPDLPADAFMTIRGRNSTFGNSDNMTGDISQIRVAQSPSLTGPWTERSNTSGTGAIVDNTDYSRTTSVAVPGPIAPLATYGEYFALATTYIVPLVIDPTAVTATPVSSSQINVAFTPNVSSNNVVIVFNLTGTFTAPVGAPPAPGGSLAGGTVLYNGLSSPYSHSSLSAVTPYYYKLFSYDGVNYSPGVTTNATTLANPVALPYTQDFEGTFPPLGWQNYGTKTWTQTLTGGVGGTKAARVSYTPAGTANLQTLPVILPASPSRIKFWWKDNDIAARPGDGPEIAGYDTTYLEISTNGGTSWTVLTFLAAASSQSAYVESVTDLTPYAGQTASFRWRDVSDGSFSAYGTGLDDLTIEVIPPGPVYAISPTSKNFGPLVSGNSSAPQDFTITNSGAANLIINTGGITLTGTNANQFVLGSITYPITVIPGGNAVITVTFSPTSAGSKSANLNIVHNAPGSPSVVALSGQGLAAGVLFEDFTNVDALARWKVVNLDGGLSEWYRSTLKFNSSPASAGCDYESDASQNNDWLISPKLTVAAGDSLTFLHSIRSTTYPESLYVKIGTTNDPLTGTWTDLAIIYDNTLTWKYKKYDLSAYAGQQIYVAFVDRSQDAFTVYVDDITGPIVYVPAVDLAFTNFYQSSGLPVPRPGEKFNDYRISMSESNSDFKPITKLLGNVTGMRSSDVNNTILVEGDNGNLPIELNNVSIKAFVKNFGLNAASYNLAWNIDGVSQTPYSGPSVAPGATDSTVFSHTPTVRGTFLTAGNITVAADENPDNNANDFRMRVYPDVFTRTIYDRGDNVVDTYIGWGPTGTTPFKAGVRFTAAAEVKLAGVDFIFNTETLTPGEITVQVRAAGTTTTAPGAVLYTAVFNTAAYFPGGGDYIHLPFGNDAPTIASGSDYWITVKVPLGASYPGGAHANGFTLGRSFYESNTDTTLWNALILTPDEYAWIMRSVEVTAGPATFAFSKSVNNGWNMVSVPGLHPTNQNVTTWWPGKDPAAGVFRFSGGYVSVTTTTPGQGYWMKHVGPFTYNYTGIQVVTNTPIAGVTGWNLIGGYELNVLTSGITTSPAGLQTGSVFQYGTGYTVATNLVPGTGYWIKLTGAGSINIPTSLAKGLAKTEVNTSDWGKIIITDAVGKSYTLYTVKGEVNLNDYELPPAPPTGMFDVRFGSGRYAEVLSAVNQSIELNSLEYPVRVRVENADIRLQDGTGNGLNERLKSGEEVTISNSAINKLMVSGDVIPATYSLDQNYPNPFNPSTKIEFSIPEDVNNVTLTIYNALGQRVAELVNSKMEAGKYSYVWNASDVATGLYIYELRTDKFVSVKKMMLLK